MLNYRKIVNKLVELKKQDDKIDEVFWDFFHAISPDQHVPFIEFKWVSWYLDAIKIIDNSLEEDLSRFIYEVNLKEKNKRKIEHWEIWKEFIINSKNDFIKYLEIINKK